MGTAASRTLSYEGAVPVAGRTAFPGLPTLFRWSRTVTNEPARVAWQ